ncbi:MAG: hypothetical protein DSM106950_08260 [Stigonema ocellatum SAG 48.90 = DSM 106950]|nr:hypothetical protein [Stigonema ocellatum SAG 48.90 = DSM 106950]
MNDYDMARQLVQVMLKVEPTPTQEIIQEKVKAVVTMLANQRNGAVDVDEDKLVRELESLFNISMGIGTILDDRQEDHIPWLPDRRSEISWDFWNRYRRYLEEEKGWAPATIDRLDLLTDEILERLEYPLRTGSWDRRGMVVGQVQSGKTANYTGLICKAVDAGYKLIIVLAGLQNSLRSQTLRASKMYDTLMQMGRWFGYKPGYLDVCRLYTTDELVEWYKHITVASEELRQEFDYMADSGATPEDFGFKVRTHPQGLMITGANKMRTGAKMELSFAGSISETTIFYKDDRKNQINFEVTEELLRSLGAYIDRENDNYIWKNIPADKIIDFFSGYESHPKCRVAKTSLLTEYIKAQRPMNELVSWTVILISNKQAENMSSIAGHAVGLILRKQADSSTSQEYRLRKSRLLSPTDEWLDLPQPTRDAILDETRRLRQEAGKPPSSSKTPNGTALRSKRSAKNGLLLLYPVDPAEINSDIPIIGFVVSFPNSTTAKRIEYHVNNIYWEQEFGQI